MTLLADTHIVYWAITGDSRLTKQASSLLTNPGNLVFVSVVSLWEATIKASLGKFPVDSSQLWTFASSSGFRLLDLEPEHCDEISKLPSLHGDPFDRMLIAQCSVESMALLTSDAFLGLYGPMIRVC